ncbi:MAG TPA: YsnF/AvaK domain-containing protein [Chloroflexia bacterium]|nr:YsnF/AvaK domain-containing protein [Chloroflexia bacterium]
MTSYKEQVVPGAKIEASDGYIGRVEQALFNSQTGELSSVMSMPNPAGEQLVIPAEWFDDSSSSDIVRLKVSREEAFKHATKVPVVNQNVQSQSHNQPGQTVATPSETQYQSIPSHDGSGQTVQGHDTLRESELAFPVAEERLNVTKRPVDLGEVRLHKSVEQVEETQKVPLTHDDLDIERIPMNQPLEKPVEPYYDGDWYVMPVMKEVVVVQKQLILTEEVRIRKRAITEEKEVREQVRRERIQVENASPTGKVYNSAEPLPSDSQNRPQTPRS